MLIVEIKSAAAAMTMLDPDRRSRRGRRSYGAGICASRYL